MFAAIGNNLKMFAGEGECGVNVIYIKSPISWQSMNDCIDFFSPPQQHVCDSAS